MKTGYPLKTRFIMRSVHIDLSDIDKLHYLKSILTGEAAAKVRIFEIEGINYSNAWKILERAYEVKRIRRRDRMRRILRQDGCAQGRYIVRLPFRNTSILESQSTALKRLSVLEHKLKANITLKMEYTGMLQEYTNSRRFII